MQQLRYLNNHYLWVINDVHAFFIGKSAIKETGQKQLTSNSAYDL